MEVLFFFLLFRFAGLVREIMLLLPFGESTCKM